MHADVAMAADTLRLFAGLAFKIKGATVPASAEHLHMTVREPFGVVGRIIPFNHPIMFAAGKIAAPLVAGNAVILKPPDSAPLSALRMGELFADILPPGLLSVVVGCGPAAGRALVRHPAVRRIGFIGSDATGRAIQRDAAEVGVKDITLELGGKNALIAFGDADPDQVADGVVNGMNFARSAGQSCGSTSRLLLHESVADEILERVARRMAEIKVGSPLDPDTEMGTLSSRPQYDKTLSYIGIGRDEGARLLAGGGRPGPRARPWAVRRAHVVRGRPAGDSAGTGGGLRPGAVRGHLEERGRGGAHRQRGRLRADRQRLDQRPAPRAPGRRSTGGGLRVDQRLVAAFHRGTVRRGQAVRHRPRGKPRRTAQLHAAQDRQRHAQLAAPEGSGRPPMRPGKVGK